MCGADTHERARGEVSAVAIKNQIKRIIVFPNDSGNNTNTLRRTQIGCSRSKKPKKQIFDSAVARAEVYSICSASKTTLHHIFYVECDSQQEIVRQ